ncbi:MAG: RpiB/LacA/LacB family sugar-phosphate isomerase [Candidatus Taylorbacteria bacterium]|nr:RpiB/LacA/LacB family sugar-phosphate isomerase [Candidatus Taylorbacteria bacterium]
MHIYFAGDHAGFELKQKLMEFVRSLGHEVEDLGPLEPKSGDDYPDFVIPLAQKVVGKPSTEVRGIVVAGSGQGEIIAMNRIKGARAALHAPGPQMLPLIIASRDHNDSNIFAIGARFCTLDEAKNGITVWLETPFSNAERHIRRLQKNDQYGS